MERISATYLDYYIPSVSLPIDAFIHSLQEGSVPQAFSGKEEYEYFVRDVLGLNSIPVETRLEVKEMLDILLEKFFAQGFDPLGIDLVLVVQEPGSNGMVNIGHYLQYRHRMSLAAVLQVGGNHCCNMDAALGFVNKLMLGDSRISNVLMVSYLKHSTNDKRIVGSYAVEGDGAGMMLVQRGPGGVRLLDSHLLINGALYKGDPDADNSLLHCKYYIKSLREILQNNAIKPDSLAGVVIQNANKMLIEQCLMAAGIGAEKIFLDNYGKYGHLDCLDFLINLKDVLDSPKTRKGMWLSFGTGWAGSYISSLLDLQ